MRKKSGKRLKQTLTCLLLGVVLLTFQNMFVLAKDFTENSNTIEKIQSISKTDYAISASFYYNHSAAITINGDLYCWGKNSFGQIGNGTTIDQKSPTKILSNVTKVSLGLSHSAAITKNGDLYCWGQNYCGQIGNGTTIDQKIPIKILSNASYVSLGSSHSAAITENGDLYCWGYNKCGQVGNGSTTDQELPVKVLDNVIFVSLEGDQSAAITASGDLYCWGNNYHGQVGNGNTMIDQKTPVKVLSNVASVSLGFQYSAAITENGDLYCWGNNMRGQIGNGTTIGQGKPVKVLSNIVSVSLGNSHSGAITVDGDLYCWGNNNSGQVGNGGLADQLTPVHILSNVKDFSLEGVNSVAITENGDLYSWGCNDYGQVGNGTRKTQFTPQKVLESIVFASINDHHSNAIAENGDLYYWGNNALGQVTECQLTPLKIMNLRKGENEGNNEPPISKNTVAYFRKISKNVEVREEFTFDYSLDSCLENNATEYNPDLACMLSALAVSAYQKEKTSFTLIKDAEPGTFPKNPLVITESLRNLGFNANNGGDVCEHNYYSDSTDNNYGPDQVGFTLAKKNMDDGTTLVLIVIRGSYGDIRDFTSDWQSNVNFKNMGDGLHEGFAKAAADIDEKLKDFKSDKSISGNNVKYVITGHSRGAAVANLVAKKLVDDGESKDRVYDYNFACPDSGRDYPGNWNPSGAYDNLFNINNVRDIIGVIPGNLFNKSLNINSFFFKDQFGILFWGKYGRTYFFAERWDRVQETMIGGLDQHESTLYFDHMKEKQSTNSFKSWEQARATLVKNNLLGKYFENGKIYGLFCPVNMEVVDSSGIKVAEVVDGQVKYYTDSFGDVVIITAGDQSLVYVNGSKDYFIKLTGSDTGKMTYCVSDAVFEEYGKEITYSDVSLTEGKTYVSKIDNNVLSDAVTLVLLDENFNPVKQIMSDGTEKELSPELKEDYADLPFAKAQYTIKYNLDGGAVTGNPVTYSKATATFTLKNPVKPGYTFIGWTGSNGHSPQLTVSIRQGTTGNLSYTANWQRNLPGTDDPGNGGDSLGPNEGYSFRKAIAKGTCLIADKNLYYTGNPVMPQIIVSFDGKDLIKDIDYTVSYDNNVNIGNAKVIIDGIGEFRGRKIVSFPIRAKVGTEFSYKKGKYKVINASEVSYQGITSAKTKKVQIPQIVLLGNKHFKVTKIADEALKNTKITSVVIGSQVKSIGKSSMEGCKELKQVVIGRNVSKIGKRSFGNCKKLKTITIYTSKLKSKNVGSNAFKGIYVKARVEVPEGKVKEYKKWLKSKGAGTKIKVVEKS